ncbi:hypothetical protein HYW32_03135 [Candidatus Berkelbacteria bacterium]|nr:hypothetical protein [Candidatus Berkelbacteria bacterium]
MRYHLIGINGSAMSGLAEILRGFGHTVTGSDLATTGHSATNVTGAERVIYTPAIRESSPGWVELAVARAQGLEILRADELLGELTRDAKLIAITGTHGKSSTTAMVAKICVDLGLNPTVLIGAPIPAWKGRNYRLGNPKFWVLEADDYDRKFLTLTPDIAVVTNLEVEHLDVYRDLADIQSAFANFLQKVKVDGTIIAHTESTVDEILTNLPVRIIHYGGASDEYVPALLPKLKVLGEHQRLNATAALAVADALGLDLGVAKRSLAGFTGTGRRLEYLGEKAGVLFYDDYGHHPTEIHVSLSALKQAFPNRRLVVAFQAHQHSRVKALFNSFTKAFSNATVVYLIDIYTVPGRDENVCVETQDLAAAISAAGTEARYLGSLQDLKRVLPTLVDRGDVFLTLGATDITRVGRDWLGKDK